MPVLSEIECVNQYVKEHEVDNKTYRSFFHMQPPVGWMNDPCGFCYAFDKYHIFFQYHPYEAGWGPMHWGHFTSQDLIHWEWNGIALIPNESYDSVGCFTGSAIYKDNKIYLMYTGVTDGKQEQVLVLSEDGNTFKKLGIVISEKHLPDVALKGEFRDPKITFHNGRYLCVIGSTTVDREGIILLYESIDLLNWKFVNILYHDENCIGVCECPNLFWINDKPIIIYSCLRKESSFQNRYSTICLHGFIDKNNVFVVTKEEEVDKGSDFYAAQVLEHNNHFYLLAWMGMWGRNYLTKSLSWAGQLSCVRELSLKNDNLIQVPIRSFDDELFSFSNYDLVGHCHLRERLSNCYELHLKANIKQNTIFEVHFLKGSEKETILSYDASKREYVLYSMQNQAKDLGAEETTPYKRIYKRTKDTQTLDILLIVDRSSVEVFVDGGEKTLSMVVFADDNDNQISLFANELVHIQECKVYTLK